MAGARPIRGSFNATGSRLGRLIMPTRIASAHGGQASVKVQASVIWLIRMKNWQSFKNLQARGNPWVP